MWVGDVSVDDNGIILFDPAAVALWRPDIEDGTDLFTEFFTTSVGDEGLARGLFVPILAIDDGGYDIIVHNEAEPLLERMDVVVTNGEFALQVTTGLVVADLAVLRYWMPGVGADWRLVPARPGNYAVTVRGLRRISSDRTLLEAAGYEFVLASRSELPVVTADLNRNMRVMNWWDA